MDNDDSVKSGKFLDAPERRASMHRFYSSFTSKRHHLHRRQHHYRRIERGYSPKEFKKTKPPTFDGEMTKSKDVEAWLLGIRKILKLHDYSKNFKVKIAIFNLK